MLLGSHLVWSSRGNCAEFDCKVEQVYDPSGWVPDDPIWHRSSSSCNSPSKGEWKGTEDSVPTVRCEGEGKKKNGQWVCNWRHSQASEDLMRTKLFNRLLPHSTGYGIRAHSLNKGLDFWRRGFGWIPKACLQATKNRGQKWGLIHRKGLGNRTRQKQNYAKEHRGVLGLWAAPNGKEEKRAGKAAIAWFGLSKLQDYTSKYGVWGSG